MSNIEVQEINIHPIKSCGAVSIDQTSFTERGLEYDRDRMLVDSGEKFLSQRRNPEMTQIQPSLVDGGVLLSAPAMEQILLPDNFEYDDDRLVDATLHGKQVVGQHEDDEASDWFSEFLKKDVRMLRFRPDKPRYIKEIYRKQGAANQVGFADGFPITLASEQSLEELNSDMESGGVPMNRFRPNFVVGSDKLDAYAEDNWRFIRIENLGAYVVKACDRCVITDTDQSTGERGSIVLRALFRTRRGENRYDPAGKKVFFAVNLNHIYLPGQQVRVGDEVDVIEQSSEPNVIPAQRR